MREINLNGKYYKIHSDIIQRRLNPWKAKIGAGGLEYSDFQQAELEEYFDFRNGIGKKRGVGSDARQDWSEGIDFANEGQAVLGPLVTTAGTFGVAPVKIIDFDGGTYAIGASKISKWNTGTSAWDSKDTSMALPIDAIVVTDSTDSYLVVSSATDAIYTTDGETWTNLKEFGVDFLNFTEVDANAKLTVTSTKALAADADGDEDVYLYKDYGASYFNALDVDVELYIASTSEVASCAGMAITNTVGSITDFAATDISVCIRRIGGGDYNIQLVRGNDVATDAYTCSADTLYYCTLTRAAANDVCTVTIYSDAARSTLLDTLSVNSFNTATRYQYVYGFAGFDGAGGGSNFDGYVQNLRLFGKAGYMADYDNQLYFITTDGQYVSYSTAKDIDDYSGYFELTGNFGTVYDLFEGKLLSDGTPTLYFCGTEGLYNIDTTNEIAYKQEVSYPPLTNAGHVGLYWNANVWVATGYGILKVAPSVATFLGPDQDDGLPASYQGKIYDFATVNNWLVFCVNAGAAGYSSILKRNSTLGGNQQVYTGAENAAIACVHHSPSSLYTNGRLWFGEGTSVKYMMMPDITSNVKQIATYTYVDDSGYGKLPIFRKLAAISKTALGVAAITKSCNANEYVQVYYGLNGAAPTTSLGTFKSSPKATALTFGSGLGTEFYTIQFAIKLYRGATTTNSPELESLLFYYIPTPVRISGWTFTIDASEDDSQEIFAAFETIYDTNTLVAFYPSGDVNKTSYNVKLTQMPSRNWWEEMGAREGQFQVTVEEVFSP